MWVYILYTKYSNIVIYYEKYSSWYHFALKSLKVKDTKLFKV